MDFTLPQEAIDAVAPQQPPSNGSKSSDFTLPDEALDSAASDLAQNKDFSPEQYAIANPDKFELALRADKVRKNQSLTSTLGDVGDALTTGDTYANAAKGLGKFILGLGITGAHAAAQAGLGLGAKAVRAAGMSGAADSMEAESLTEKAESTLAGQRAEEAGKNSLRIIGNKLAPAGSSLLQDPDSEPVDPATLEQVKDVDHRSDFQARIEAIKKSKQLEEGKPLDTGLVAGISRMSLGGENPSEALGPQALADAGARPANPLIVDSMAAASDPQNIALAAAPMLPGAATIGGRLTQGVGKLAQVPMTVLENIPGKLGKAATAASAGAGLAAVEGAMHSPITALKVGAGVAAAKGLQKIGQALEAQGAELATGAPSQYTTRAATAAAKGLSDVPASTARVVGDSVAKGAATAAGFAPLNAIQSEDGKQFAESEVGAATMGAALSHLASNRPMMVEALKPHLRSEGVASMDTTSDLGKKSAAFVMSMPDDVRDRTLETMGALQGIPGEAKTGEKANTKIYVLSGADYANEVAKLGGAPDDGGRGFFLDKQGRAIINGESPGSVGADDLAHTMGHEVGGHAAINILRAMGAPGAEMHKALLGAVMQGVIKDGKLTPEYQKTIEAYNKAFDPTGKTMAVDPHSSKAVEEFMAEQAGRVIAGDGAADLALPKNLRDRINEGVGRFASRFMGIDPDKLGQTSGLNKEEIGQVTGAMRDTLRQIVGMKMRGDLKPLADQPAPAPKPAPAPAPAPSGDVNTAARLKSLNIDPEALAAARDEAMKDAVGAERARRGKRPLSEKSADEVAADAGTEFDQQAENYFKALEKQGVPHPDGLDVNEAIRLNELTADQGGLPAWKNFGGRGAPKPTAAEPRIVEEPQPGEEYPYDVPFEQREALGRKGWSTAEIDAMPKSQVDRELAKPAEPAPTATATAEPDAVDKANTMNRLDRESQAATAEAAKLPIGSPERTAAQEKAADLKRQADALRPKPAPEPVKPPPTPKDATDEATVAQRLAEAETDARHDAVYAGKRTEGTKEAFVKQAKLAALMDIVTDDGARDPSLLQTRTENGRSRITGTLDESLPSHRALIREMGVSPEAARHLFELEPGKVAYVDYNSAKNQDPKDISGKQRAKELREDPASQRQLGTIQTNKAIIPAGVRVTRNGVVQVIGTSVDKFVTNAAKLIEAAKKSGIETGYEDVNDPSLLEDMQGYVENNRNNVLGDGSGPIAGREVPEDYVPYEIPEDRFHLLNAAMHNDVSTRIDSNGGKGRSDAIEAQQRALENDRPVDEETGDVNPLRALINKDGSIDTVNEAGEARKGTGENLETVFETLSPEQIISVKDEPSGETDLVRNVGFQGDPADVFPSGTPRHEDVAAGFMPNAPLASVRRSTEERTGKAALSDVKRGKPDNSPSLEDQRDDIQRRIDSQWRKTPSHENPEIKSLVKERARIDALLRQQEGASRPASTAKPSPEDTVPTNRGRGVPKGQAPFAHWSHTGGLDLLDPASHGTGDVGGESARRKEDAGSYVNRLYLGYNDYVREPQIGKNRYTGTIDKSLIYDMNRDPLDLVPDAVKLAEENGTHVSTEYEKLIKEHGFLGYHNGDEGFDSGNVMAIFHPIPASGEVGGKAFAEHADEFARRSPEMVRTVRRMTPDFERIEDSYFAPKAIDKGQVKKQAAIAEDYEKLKTDNLSDPKVKRAYDALASKIQDQYKQLVDQGIRIEPWTKKGQPYASSKELQEDLRKNKRLYFFPTDAKSFGSSENFSKEHPMLQDSGLKTKGGFKLLNNDILRAVHDAIAHGSFGYEFGPKGEEAAWKAHMATVSDPWARWALTTETRGQNSWVNFRDGFIGDDGLPLKKGDPGYISPKDRPFADQKADLLDPKWTLTGDPTVDAVVKDNKEFMRNFGRSEGGKVRNSASGQFMPNESDTPSASFKLSQRSERLGDELVPTKIAHIDRAWAGDPDYIGPDDAGIKGRRERFREWQKKGEAVEAPEVSVDPKGNVTFINGRHRFAELRDQGHEDVSVAMSPESLENARDSGMLEGEAQFMPNESGKLDLPSNGSKSNQDDLGFYSGVSKAIDAKIPKRASGDQILATLKGAGVKQEEVDHLGLAEFLKTHQGPISKQDLQDFVRAGGVQLKEVTKKQGAINDERAEELKNHLDEIEGTFLDSMDSDYTHEAGEPEVENSDFTIGDGIHVKVDGVDSNEGWGTEDRTGGWANATVTLPNGVKADAGVWITEGKNGKLGLEPYSIGDYGRVIDENGKRHDLTDEEHDQVESALNEINIKPTTNLRDDLRVSDKDFDEHIRNAKSALERGDVEDAKDELERAAALENEHGDNPATKKALRLIKNLESEDSTKFSQYVLPGGENYKEVLLTLPRKSELPDGWTVESIMDGRQWLVRDEKGKVVASSPHGRSEAVRNARGGFPDGEIFQSSHWDEPNVLAHIRQADHTDTEGNKVRLIEEIQSDWHQKGRKEGYRSTPNPITELPDTLRVVKHGKQWVVETVAQAATFTDSKGKEIPIHSVFSARTNTRDEAIAQALSKLNEGAREAENKKAPDAPFKKTWAMLAFKRALRMAVEDGADKIAWTPGEQQAERYDLSKSIDTLRYEKNKDGSFNLFAEKDGQDVIEKSNLPEDKLEETVGKDVARRIINDEYTTKDEDGHYLSGLGLKVGGEGMKGFYDKILPAEVGKYVKKWGGKVEATDLGGDHDASQNTEHSWEGANVEPIFNRGGEIYVVNRVGQEELVRSADELRDYLAENGRPRGYILGDTGGTNTVHSVTITPEMRKAILDEGQPMFMAGGLSGIDSVGKAVKSNRTMSNEKTPLLSIPSSANSRKREDKKEGSKQP